ncbi:hypothetical protein [Demequina sp. NBRC 110055]|uniref:hypothetical protein n=1 Tax=Demequina sp. NBRC 110055 TaxID=1570344 RepID=UPI0009FE8960|nr:hypothetical protein [Demequina sp. NBRC 110055]
MNEDLLIAIAIPAIALATLALATALGAPLVSWLLRRIEPAAATPGLLRGGMWVGVLERVMVTGGILIGMPEVVAVVIAIKGLGRYPELRDTAADARSEAAERFIIGTLASLIWAGVLGVLGRWAILALL